MKKKKSEGTMAVSAVIIEMCVNSGFLFSRTDFFFSPIYSKKRFLGVEVCVPVHNAKSKKSQDGFGKFQSQDKRDLESNRLPFIIGNRS